MTKPKSAEEKAKDQEAREAGGKKKDAAKPMSLETAIEELEQKFKEWIQNVGYGALDEMVKEMRKSKKEGNNEDKVDGEIKLRLSMEGMKLTLNGRTQVVVRDVHKDEFPALVADPVQPELPGIGTGKKAPKLEAGEAGVDPNAAKAQVAAESGEGEPQE